jgi:proteasome lid subunit RPN8/RPN11
LRPDAVEVSDMQVLESSAEFEKYGMKVLGWYHSHPRIKPMPSTKDLNTQLQVQSMIPYAIGIIAGIYSPNTNFGTAPKKYARASDPSHAAISNSYFSFFRALEDDSGKAGVAVNVTIHRLVCFRKQLFGGIFLTFTADHLCGLHGSCKACAAPSGALSPDARSRHPASTISPAWC